jgi:hypothetical protein
MASPMSAERFQDRWEAYKGTPSQVAGIWGLYASIAALENAGDILDEHANWAKTFSPPKMAAQVVPAAAKPRNPLALPFFGQLDNGPDGWRQCQSSAIAMNLAFLKVPGIKDDLDYIRIAKRHGDTTAQAAHIAALRELGAPGRFVQNSTVAQAKAEIDKGYGLAFGILHHGPATAPTGGGHWIAVCGYNSKGWLVHDPYGNLDLANGRWLAKGGATGRGLHYSFKNTNPRWLVEGPGSGWAWIFSKS